jgi:hypothetical protein
MPGRLTTVTTARSRIDARGRFGIISDNSAGANYMPTRFTVQADRPDTCRQFATNTGLKDLTSPTGARKAEERPDPAREGDARNDPTQLRNCANPEAACQLRCASSDHGPQFARLL